MNTPLAAAVLAFLVWGSSAQASMTLSSWQPAQKAAAPTASTPTTSTTISTSPPTTPSMATTPGDAAPGKARAPISPRTVTKPSADTLVAAAATGRSAGAKRGKVEQAEDRDEHSEDSPPQKARPAQRAADPTKGGDDGTKSSRKRGLEKIGRILEAMHRMRPNFFARWR
jgi:hypothetical protein